LFFYFHHRAFQTRPTGRNALPGVQSLSVNESPVVVEVKLARVRQNAEEIRRRAGVPIIAVVKADAYGLGLIPVARAIADIVEGFCVFNLEEAQSNGLWEATRKPILALATEAHHLAEDFRAAHVRPAVWNAADAHRLAGAGPVLCVDMGMQRFACPVADVESVLGAAKFDEAFTHAIHVAQARAFAELVGGRGLRLHAAGSSLLDEPAARLDAVRPGIALYRGAVQVTTRLIDVRDSNRPAGYSEFKTPRFGVIRCGYYQGLRRGPCLINGQIRNLLEVGMQSAFVEAGSNDKVGDLVTLLGESLNEARIAAAWNTSEHETLTRLCRLGQRIYVPPG
jgi:alanine racemase